MEEHREKDVAVGDCKEPMEKAGKGRKGLRSSSKTKTLVGEDAKNSNSGDVSGAEQKTNDGGLASGDGSLKEGGGNTVGSGSDEEQVTADVGSVEDVVESKDAVETNEAVSSDDDITEPETERNEIECEVDAATVKSENGANHGSAGEDETVTSAGNEVALEKENCEVGDNGGACDAEQNVQTDKSQQTSGSGETLSVEVEKADQGKESTNKPEDDNTKTDVDSKEANEENVGLDEQGNLGSETEDAKHSESAQAPEEAIHLNKGEANKENSGIVSEGSSPSEVLHEEEITNVDQKEENGEAMEIDCAEEEQVEKDVGVGAVLDNAGNESAGASVIQNPDVPVAEADKNDSDVVKEMEIDKQKDNASIVTDPTRTTESADSVNPNSTTEDAATGEVEPVDHNALFDPSSDITNFIDFSGVSSWSGNIQDLKTETGNVSLKEDKKPTDMAEEVAMVDCNETQKSVDAKVNAEARVIIGAESPAAVTDCSKEAPDATLRSEKNHEDKDHQCVDKKTADQQDTSHESPSIDPNQKEDTEMEENPSNSDYGTDSGIKTNGVKRKADVLSEESPVEGRKTVSFAKVSFAERPSFKIGACIARAASQMAGSPSVLKGGNVGDETLSVESFVFQLHCAATNPDKENVVSEIAAGFFLDFRNSSASQQVAPEKVGSKRGRPSNSNAGGTEAFEFEEMGDTYWTDRVIHNGGEEQTPPTEKGYQVVPVELKPAEVQRTRRPYKRRKSQMNMPPPASAKPADFDENAPAELIMNFCETDTIPPEKSLSKMFRHFGPIRESQTDVDTETNRARVVFRKGVDAEVAYNSAGKFNIFGTKMVKYELSYKITETFKVQPYVVSLGEEEVAPCLAS